MLVYFCMFARDIGSSNHAARKMAVSERQTNVKSEDKNRHIYKDRVTLGNIFLGVRTLCFILSLMRTDAISLMHFHSTYNWMLDSFVFILIKSMKVRRF